MNWRPVVRVGLNLVLGFGFAGAVGLWIIAFAPTGNVSRDFRIIGLGFNVFGALLTLLPRAMRGLSDIEDQTSTQADYNPAARAALRRDTIIALTGITIIMVGFLLQLVGNVLPPTF